MRTGRASTKPHGASRRTHGGTQAYRGANSGSRGNDCARPEGCTNRGARVDHCAHDRARRRG